jgi:hypothetical protein
MTYAELYAAIQAYTENTFPETFLADGSAVSTKTQIDTFIKQAELRIYNTVQFPSLRKNVTGSLTVNNKYLSCPNDFLASYSLAVVDPVNGQEFLLNKDVNFIRQAYPKATDLAFPKYYALFGPTVTSGGVTNELSFIVGPTPDASYDVELHYYYYPTSIVTAGTSWLGDNFDTVLLYGSLVEAYIFMKGEQDVLATYQAKYADALAQAKRLGDGMEKQDQYRSGAYRQAVT